MKRLLPCIFAVSLLATACDDANKNADAEDASNPNFKAAADALAQGNYTSAAEAYEDALAASPRVASAHYELGILYGDRLNDPVSSMYHFERYLDKRPSAENRGQAEELLEAQRTTFLASLPNSPVQNSEALARLEAENRDLRNQVQDLQTRVNALKTEPADTSSARVAPSSPATMVIGDESTAEVVTDDPAAPPAAATSILSEVASEDAVAAPVAEPVQAARSHTVAQGDNLWKISKEYYEGNVMEGIERIKEANPDVNPKNLKIGTVLVIP